MKRNFIAPFLLLAVMLTLSVQASAGKLTSGSKWVNQRGSVLTINSVASNGLMSGTYVNNDTSFGCVGIEYPMTGWFYVKPITFAVTWNNSTKKCNSLTSWIGFVTGASIQTNWTLVTVDQQTLTGKDTFKYSP
ncbi:MAG TPA: hypothetical protein ENI79_05860 [Rhodospirillales bacterium]|nr:hypothetical protein [Rhodospirillales bacterium]